jgi:glycosyltransferase involved in cell wall biosynthesis
VLTSTNENQGLVILEAMAHSVPVICSSIGPFEDMVLREAGSAILIKNKSELTEAILTLISNPDSRERLVSQATKLVYKFTWDNVALEYEKLFTTLISEPHLSITSNVNKVLKANIF